MYIIGASFNKQSGPDATKSYNLSLDIDETQKQGLLKLIADTNKGEPLLLLIFKPDDDNGDLVTDLASENPVETKNRLRKQMHAMINDIAKEKNVEPEKIKDILRKYLIKKNYMKKSTTELGIEGFSAAIYYLNNEFATATRRLGDAWKNMNKNSKFEFNEDLLKVNL